MGRLVRDERKATVTQITTRYNQGMQNTISEHSTRQTLNQMGSSSRRPHRVPLLSAKNRTQRLQFTQAHQNLWTGVFYTDNEFKQMPLIQVTSGGQRSLLKKKLQVCESQQSCLFVGDQILIFHHNLQINS